MNEAILLILHEAGHAFNTMGMDKKEYANQRSYRMKANAAIILGDTEIWKDSRFTEEYKRYVVQEERDAWYYALRVLRELKAEGFPITSMSNKEIIESISRLLGSYTSVIESK